MEADAQRGDHAEVPAAAQRPEQFGVVIGRDKLAVGEYDLCSEQVVSGQPGRAQQRAVASAEGKPGYADGARGAHSDVHTV
jgi:hypothetical protein